MRGCASPSWLSSPSPNRPGYLTRTSGTRNIRDGWGRRAAAISSIRNTRRCGPARPLHRSRGAADLAINGWWAALAAFVVAAAARRAGALRTSGAAAAFGVGFVIFGWGGLGGALPLLLFFVSASALTRLRLRRRTAPSDDAGADDAVGRGGMQVVANGIVPSAALLGFARWPHPGWLLAFAGALAAVTADTWATELGGFSRRPPVLVTTGERVAPG